MILEPHQHKQKKLMLDGFPLTPLLFYYFFCIFALSSFVGLWPANATFVQ